MSSPHAPPFWTLARIAKALGSGPADDRPIAGITTDTRKIRHGECFLALRGENFDGHDFLGDAVQAGAAALIVDDARKAPVPGVPVFEVPDTLIALGQLGRFPLGLEQPRGIHPVQGPVQGAVRDHRRAVSFGERARECESEERPLARLDGQARIEDRELDREEHPWASTWHGGDYTHLCADKSRGGGTFGRRERHPNCRSTSPSGNRIG